MPLAAPPRLLGLLGLLGSLGNILDVPPSPRPLLIWLGMDAVSAALLALVSLALLAAWRRPSGPWRLGVAALALSWLGGAATLLVYLTYRADASLADGCPEIASCVQTIMDAQVWVGVMSVALIAAALAVLVAALVSTSARGGVSSGPDGAPDAQYRSLWLSRWMALALGEAVAGLGALTLTRGVYDAIQFSYLLEPGRAGDGIGLIPAINAYGEALIGAVLLGVGLVMLVRMAGRLSARGRRARPAAE